MVAFKRLAFMVTLAVVVVISGCALLRGVPDDAMPDPPPGEPGYPGEDPAESAGDREKEESSDRGDSGVEVLLYMPNETGHWLQPTRQVISGDDDADLYAIVEAWQEMAHFLPPVEIEANVEGSTARVSFSPGIADLDVDYEELVILSLVNTITELPGIDSVWVLIDGEESYTLAGRSYIGDVFYRDETLIERDGFRPIAPADPRRGERFLEGVVLDVNEDQPSVRVELTESSAEMTVRFTEEAVIGRQTEDDEKIEIGLGDIGPGETVGMIVTREGKARALIALFW